MRVNVLGNGDWADIFQRGTEGKLLVCNMPPMQLTKQEVYASCMVDFKMMAALQEGSVNLGMYDWILGNRPRRWMEQNPTFYLKYSQNIKGFWTHVPPYAQLPGHAKSQAATNYSCGHMAVDYACRKMRATEVHLYGFDSMFDLNLRSCTDLVLESDRSSLNTHRLATNWRPIWSNFFKEFSEISFTIYHRHDKIKFPIGKNVKVIATKEDKND